MSSIRLFPDWLRGLLFVLLLALGCNAPGQTIALHLLNGDRVAGNLVSETTNEIILDTTWAKHLVIPINQVHSRELLPNNSVTNAPNVTTTTNLIGNNLLAMPTEVVTTKSNTTLVVATNTFWSRWKGELAVGLELERGAADHDLYYGRGKLTYAQPYESDPKQFFRNIFNYDAEYGKTAGVLSDNRMSGSSKTDFDLSRRYYVYNLGEAYYDRIRLIDLHYEEGPGLGYHWLTGSNLVVNFELGANYQVEQRSDDTETDSFYYRVGQDLTWKLNKLMTFTEKIEYFDKAGYLNQYRIRFESTLSYALLYNMSLNVTVDDTYDTQPAVTVPNNDFQLRTSLGLKF